MKTKKQIPVFKNEDQERQFWDKHDLTEFLDQLKPANIDFSQLKPSTKPITVRLPESLLHNLKKIAHKNDVPYQSLLKIYLSDRIKQELKSV